MTITDIADLNKFLGTNGGIISHSKIESLLIASRQVTDSDLSQVLSILAESLSRKEKFWQVQRGTELNFFGGAPETFGRIYLEEGIEQYYFTIEFNVGGSASSWFSISPDDCDWNLKRRGRMSKSLYQALSSCT